MHRDIFIIRETGLPHTENTRCFMLVIFLVIVDVKLQTINMFILVYNVKASN
jgi:hypothetical protein